MHNCACHCQPACVGSASGWATRVAEAEFAYIFYAFTYILNATLLDLLSYAGIPALVLPTRYI